MMRVISKEAVPRIGYENYDLTISIKKTKVV